MNEYSLTRAESCWAPPQQKATEREGSNSTWTWCAERWWGVRGFKSRRSSGETAIDRRGETMKHLPWRVRLCWRVRDETRPRARLMTFHSRKFRCKAQNDKPRRNEFEKWLSHKARRVGFVVNGVEKMVFEMLMMNDCWKKKLTFRIKISRIMFKYRIIENWKSVN